MPPDTPRLLCQLPEGYGLPGTEDEVRALVAQALVSVAETEGRKP